jgi:hypothetical protein
MLLQGYLRGVRALCDKYNVLWISDEVSVWVCVMIDKRRQDKLQFYFSLSLSLSLSASPPQVQTGLGRTGKMLATDHEEGVSE